jgi:hypothetical protein
MTKEDEGHYAKKHPHDSRVNPEIEQALKQLASNGEVACAVAFKIATDLNIDPGDVGTTADLLEMRLTKCQLGLFGYQPVKRIVKPAREVSKDLEEGISYEAAALAGHLSLKDLIVIYDSNNITIEGDTSVAWSEDVAKRFEAQNWNVLSIDGHDYDAIDAALTQAKQADKPTIIIADTTIGKGAIGLEGSHETHGAPLGEETIRALRIPFREVPRVQGNKGDRHRSPRKQVVQQN